jgi:hypothetical protein
MNKSGRKETIQCFLMDENLFSEEFDSKRYRRNRMTVKRLVAKNAGLNPVESKIYGNDYNLYERKEGKRVSEPYKILQNYYRYRTQQF